MVPPISCPARACGAANAFASKPPAAAAGAERKRTESEPSSAQVSVQKRDANLGHQASGKLPLGREYHAVARKMVKARRDAFTNGPSHVLVVIARSRKSNRSDEHTSELQSLR